MTSLADIVPAPLAAGHLLETVIFSGKNSGNPLADQRFNCRPPKMD